MNKKLIFDLIDKLEQSKIECFEYESEEFRLKIDKGGRVQFVSSPAASPVAADIAVPAPASEPAPSEPSGPAQTGHVVKSPIVGTYYHAPSPDAAPFVAIGKQVKKGDIVCIVEAMKVMNEIECDFEGEIAEILVKNGQMVEFGQPLLVIQ